eukprot:2886489-Amphidinium_carterae.1
MLFATIVPQVNNLLEADQDTIYINVLPGYIESWERLAVLRPDLQLFRVAPNEVDALMDSIARLNGVQAFRRSTSSFPSSGAVGMAIAFSICGHIDAY